MPSELQLCAASDAQRLEAYKNVHDVWGGGLPIEEHLARRLASVQHNRARWFVGCVDDRVVSSLASYPMQFWLRGELLPGMAIGSVHTLAEFRGCGYAPQLLAWVEQQEADAGARISLLYSDLDPAYYARLGYLLGPSYEGWANLEHTASSGDGRLIEVKDDKAVDQLATLYDAFHGSLPVAIARGTEYRQHLRTRRPDDRFFRLESATGESLGYVRVAEEPETLRLVDYALARHDDHLADAMYETLIGWAAEHGFCRVGGWLPDMPATRARFPLAARRREIAMLKPLAEDVKIDEAAVGATDRFCEVDHV